MPGPEQTRIERRCGQRFDYQVPVLLRVPQDGRSGAGFTHDLSSRGALVWTDFSLAQGTLIEMTLVMPSEITLAENMNVCCRARVLRVEYAAAGEKPAVAVQIEKYEFLNQVPVLQEHIHTQPHPARP
jgi:hypothetical protein